VQSKSAQTLDVYGNITQSQVFAYGNLSTAARTYNYTYLTDGNYTSRYIRNRVTQVTVTDAGGTTVHDASYGTSLVYRGNPTSVVSLGDAKYVGYEISGVAYQWRDGAGHTYTTDPSSTTNYSLPGVLTPGGNANLATSITYAGSFAVTSVSGPNGATGTTTYDSYGRPAQNTIPDGAQTNYTYTYNPNTQTATLGSGTGARWKKTTLDRRRAQRD